ncbi:MAG: DUF1684 domain-containing protein [Lishizhenia sp.]
MKTLTTLLFVFLSISTFAQAGYAFQLEKERTEKNELFKSDSSILNPKERDNLIALDFFAIDKRYKVVAKITKNRGKKFKMQTSTDRLPIYRRYGFIEFTLNDTLVKLSVYENLGLKKMKEYKNYLFLPVYDYTCPTISYGSGRYLDLVKPKGKEIEVDFNLLYNPYCAYSNRYSCPVTPKENRINLAILAGEKIPKLKNHD